LPCDQKNGHLNMPFPSSSNNECGEFYGLWGGGAYWLGQWEQVAMLAIMFKGCKG
jgi:hypothetical protein